jgi:PPOX class probable FMN-dependent enzyme
MACVPDLTAPLPPSGDDLRASLGDPGRSASEKKIDHLDDACREVLAASPFVVVATSGADGSCDASPRGGPPGFVRVLTPHRLAIGELPGNRLFDGADNLAENPHAALLVLVPGVRETLRIEGRAHLSTDPEVRSATAIDGREPWGALVLDVERAFVHCGKSLTRSHLWDPDSWLPAGRRPRKAGVLAAHLAANRGADEQSEPATVDRVEADLEEAYRLRLW